MTLKNANILAVFAKDDWSCEIPQTRSEEGFT